MTTREIEQAGSQDPYADLEIAWMEEYLGRSLASLKDLPEAEALQLRIKASTYACLKRTAIEARAHCFHEVQRGSGPHSLR